ncbi:4a-hydroxytetrahydrobiopterin dehydratase [Candidatus Parcubacteria bacterium]|nr:4a-hydroxytetrahydrobiopterin dehydratase [Candidatus Parcubacteria bacterium]
MMHTRIPGWKRKGNKIEKIFIFESFLKALDFVNKVGALAEGAGHHPDIHIFDYKNVKLTLTTHELEMVTEKDFVLAEKVNELQPQG